MAYVWGSDRFLSLTKRFCCLSQSDLRMFIRSLVTNHLQTSNLRPLTSPPLSQELKDFELHTMMTSKVAASFLPDLPIKRLPSPAMSKGSAMVGASAAPSRNLPPIGSKGTAGSPSPAAAAGGGAGARDVDDVPIPWKILENLK